MRDWGSFWRGVRSMRPRSGKINYGVWRAKGRFWCHVWTPAWAEGRGPYVSIGLGRFAVGRGY
jgi:hypothetical protein